jgi:large subunit ribosomal protein L23
MKPIVTEKAVMLIERDNVLTFEVDKRLGKEDIKKQFEEIFEAKVTRVNTLIRNNKKYVYIKLKKETPAIDVATKLGLI